MEPSWGFGAGPGAEPLVIDIDSTICEVDGNLKHGAEPEPRGSEPERFGLSDELGAFVIAVAYVQSELGRLLRE